ncbi:MAG: hypothetical protein Fur0025_19550 [Oscillatoriaceae cyanobacterium]
MRFNIKSLIFPALLTLILTIIIGLSLPVNAWALENNIKFDRLSADQGLVGVNCILQDSKGFIWFCTQEGVNKYDGYNFTLYKNDPADPDSLSDNWISSIYEDRTGKLWLGTQSGGLNQFDRNTEQFIRYIKNPNQPNSLSDNRISAIYEDSTGTLWIGTNGGGLNKFDRDTEQFTRYLHDPNNPNSLSNDQITAIHADGSGVLWIGTNGGGLNKFDPDTSKFTRYVSDATNPNSLSNDQIRAIYEDRTGQLWIGTNGGGLNQFDRNTEQFIRYLHDPNNPNSLSIDKISAIAEDGRGYLWIGSGTWDGSYSGKGIDILDPAKKNFTHYSTDPSNPNSLSSNDILSLYADKTGAIWMGTWVSGVNRFDAGKEKFHSYKIDPNNPDGLHGDGIWAIYKDRFGALWIGTSKGGLHRLDINNKNIKHYQHNLNNKSSLISDNIWSIHEDNSGRLWVGTDAGLFFFDDANTNFIDYTYNPNNPNSLSDNTVLKIYEDRSGNLWIGTMAGGINQFDPATGKFIRYQHDANNPNSLSDNLVTAICEDSSGTLWIGTYGGGLNRFDLQTGKFTHYRNIPNDPNSLSSDRIMSIYEDESGTLWIGTEGGLNRFDREKQQFKHYTEKNGLASAYLGSILPDSEGNLWLSSNKGLIKFNPKTETARNYNVDDGLPSNSFNGLAYYKSPSGEMFFGGDKGITFFYPEQVKDNPHIPPVVLTGFRKFNEPVKLETAISEAKSLNLSYQDKVITFEFAALDYTNPSKNQYAYKLEGFDKDWIYNGTKRYATYTNLDGGTYTFHVKGSNNDGVWNETGTSIKITVTPPPWKTWWAYTLYALALAGAVAAYVRWKTITQERENAALRDSERKLNQILEAIPVGISVFDATGQPYYINQTAQEVLGRDTLASAQVEEHPEIYQCYFAGTDELYPAEQLPLARALKGEKSTVDNLELRQGDKNIPLEILGTPIFDEQGKIIYAIAAFQDITQRKQAEAERLRFTQELEAKNAALEEMDRLKDEFLANTSHELRTPLNGIIGLTESLIDGIAGELSPKAITNLKTIATSGRRLSNLINDILDFSKLQHQSIQLQAKPVALRELAEVVLTLSEPLAGKKPLQLINAIPAELPLALADENRVQQILQNLIGNAIKFTESGVIEVSAVVVEEEPIPPSPSLPLPPSPHPPSPHLAITISDTGIGIPEDKFDRIFESFEQADGSTARIYGGTGLGLAITKQLVELHGGTISVTSQVGVGSQFTFTLPITTAESPASTPVVTLKTAAREFSEEVATLNSLPVMDSSNFKILLVDDEPINLQVLANNLVLQHYAIGQATNGIEALEMLENGFNPDLILLDVMMPRMTGYEVTRRIREKKPANELPILLLTAKNQVGDLVAGFEAGANDYLTKPIEKDELFARIKTHLNILKLRTENIRLGAEIDVTRRLQQMLLPSDRELNAISDLEIAGFMEPASEVGGDYYDVQIHAGRVKIGIGDVTGHGLYSGVLMMMVQMAVRTLLKSGVTNPVQFLSLLNLATYGNLQRINCDKNMTLLLLDYHEGTFWASGQHEEIIIVRTSGEVEIIDTIDLGFPIGLEEDIADFVAATEVHLSPGDVVVLYTDGITEAENMEKVQYGLERLVELSRQHHHLSAHEINQLIIADLYQHIGKQTIYDDITLLVLKQR